MKHIQNYNFSNESSLQIIADYLKSKEKFILENFPFISDFGTGIREDQVTSRAGGYNVFHMKDECPELHHLLNFISESYLHYLDNVLPNKTFDNKDINPAINCWLNILNKSENINMHKHAEDYGDLWSFVSGTFVLNAKNTSTFYKNNLEMFENVNVDGQLTIFPPFYYHWTSIHTDETPRLTLGFDIFFQKDHTKSDINFYNTLVDLSKNEIK